MIEFRGLQVLQDGRRVGELLFWQRTGVWRFVDMTRAHFNAGRDLDAAKAFVIQHLREAHTP